MSIRMFEYDCACGVVSAGRNCPDCGADAASYYWSGGGIWYLVSRWKSRYGINAKFATEQMGAARRLVEKRLGPLLRMCEHCDGHALVDDPDDRNAAVPCPKCNETGHLLLVPEDTFELVRQSIISDLCARFNLEKSALDAHRTHMPEAPEVALSVFDT